MVDSGDYCAIQGDSKYQSNIIAKRFQCSPGKATHSIAASDKKSLKASHFCATTIQCLGSESEKNGFQIITPNENHSACNMVRPIRKPINIALLQKNFGIQGPSCTESTAAMTSSPVNVVAKNDSEWRAQYIAATSVSCVKTEKLCLQIEGS
jgi:hypothetical protein